MPRKVNYGLDYDDEDYDAYEDYDYDHDDDLEIENNGKEPELKQETVRRDVWRCSICTYDNEEGLTACDICGVLRKPLGRVGSNIDKKTAPFKFDVPSPDDVISNGLRSSKVGSKASVSDVESSGVSSKAAKKNSAVRAQSSAEWSDSSSTAAQKDQQARLDKGISSGNRAFSHPHGSSRTTTVQSNGSLPDSSSLQPTSSHMEEGISSLVIGGKPESLTTSSKNMSSDARSGHSKIVSSRGSHSRADYKPEKWMLPDEAVDTLTQLNLAIVGHVDSGKSTLSGRLLHLLGRVSKKDMHKYEKEAKSQGKGSFAYAWALDESAEERERGITMNVAVAYFDSRKYHVVVLDSPGHKDFVPNMISGATQADAAILLVDASCGAFEAGIKGQTMEHAQLIRSFGVDQIIVAVNKMDVVEYSKDRFDEIKQTLGTFLHSRGFKDSSVYWVPLSVMENQNLVSAPSEARLLSWYRGPSLLDSIDSLQPPTRDFQRPLLMPICDVIRSTSLGQVSACGKLEAGALRSGSKVLVMPSGELGTVRSLERDSQACSIARAGDNVGVTLQGIDGGHVMAGGVLCHPGFPVAVAKHLELKVLLLDVATPILIGSQVEFHIHHAKEAARVVKILSLIDPKGKVTKKSPRCLLAKQRAVIEVVLQGPVCVEEYTGSKALGSVSLRASGNTVALGVVNRIIKEQE
ncbi:elongation factor 1-alpha [Rosa sericea]